MPTNPATVARQVAGARMDLGAIGLHNAGKVHAHTPAAALVELAVRRGEGILTDAGAIAAYTGAYTGRSPKDRYLVPESARPDAIDWGAINRPMDAAVFDRLFDRARAYLQGRDLFVGDASAGADPRCALSVRVIADLAWHGLFAQCLLRPPVGRPPEWTVVCAAGMKADPAADGTRSEVIVVLNLERRIVLIGGTEYAGEIKKAVFSVLNYLLPLRGILSMHCSANIGPAGDTALFFGLSGTGKTTLSADPGRRLIGDDEHGWSDDGVFNIEGGCYAKTIRLSRDHEPQIWNAIRFGAVLENVVVDPRTRRADYDDARHTENTRAAYPVDFIDGAEPTGRGGHPRTILFLTCDAFGVLPPLSRLTPAQAMYHFLSGYTAKVAGTERGVTAPEATFSTCFAAPFLPLHPTRYAALLHERLHKHAATVWLVNTGWIGGAYGQGHRIPIAETRALVQAALDGSLAGVSYETDPVFGLAMPKTCPGVPSELLRPRDAWPDAAAYDAQARRLAGLFRANFQTYAAEATEAVRAAGPRE